MLKIAGLFVALLLLPSFRNCSDPGPSPSPDPTVEPSPTASPSPTAEPTATPTVEPPTPPPPTPTPEAKVCPKDLAAGAVVYLNDKPYGQGLDSTVLVKGDPEFCFLIHGVRVNECHLEGWPRRVACEKELLSGFPHWQFSTNGGKTWEVCHDDQNAPASCDHFGDPANHDDPKTPTTGDSLATLRGFEGRPLECGLERDQFGPNACYFTIAHGGPPGCDSKKGGPYWHVRACKPDGTGCGPWRPFCK